MFYALGGGHGHFHRSLALARALGEAVDPLFVLPERLKGFCPLPCRCPPDPQSLSDWLAAVLDDVRPDLLLVDVFPRGVLADLPEGPWKKVLVTRWVHPRYYLSPPVLAALRGYDLVLASEPLHPDLLEALGPVHRIEPLILRQPDRTLNLPRPTVLALGSGPQHLQQRLQHRLQALSAVHGFWLRWSSMTNDPTLYPAAAWFRDADLVVSAAGYQTFYEVVEAGVPALFLPQKRKTDDQAGRAEGRLGVTPPTPCRVARTPSELERELVWLLENARPSPGRRLQGAVQAAQRVAELL